MSKKFQLLCVIWSMVLVSLSAYGEEKPAEPNLVTAKGSFFSRFEVRDGYGKGQGEEKGESLVRFRARLGLYTKDFQVTDSLSFMTYFVPQAGGLWHTGGNSLDDPSLGLHEGGIRLNHKMFKLDVGRFEMAYGEHLVIGTVGWHQLGRAFDGMRLSLRPNDSSMFIDVFCTTLDEGLVNGLYGDPLFADDLYFVGLYAGLGGLMPVDMALDVYVLSRIWGGRNLADGEGADWEPAAEGTAGVRAKGKFGMFTYRLEVGGQFGARQPAEGTDPNDNNVVEPISVIAFQGDVEVGLDMVEKAHVKFSIEGFFATGDDPETDDKNEGYNHLFPTAHKWLGLMDKMGARNNIFGSVFHVVGVFKPVTLKLDVHNFFRPEVADDAESFQGSEIDFGAIWAIGKGLKLRLVYGIFLPEPEDDDIQHFGELELRATF